MNLENCQEKQENISIRTVPTTEEITGRSPTLETVEIRGREQFYKMRIRWSWCLKGNIPFLFFLIKLFLLGKEKVWSSLV